MSVWAGFTDAELQKLKGSGGKTNLGTNSATRKQSNVGKPKSAAQRQIIAQNKKVESSLKSHGVIPPEQSLSNTNNNVGSRKISNSFEEPARSNTDSTTTAINMKERDDNGNMDSNKGRQQDLTTELKEVRELELDQTEALSLEMSKLEKYQHQQKMIEELNKQRKQLLSKAISERSKKAKAESSKLTHIEKELRHLDHLLTADVSLIRDRIEEASLAFMDAQKRYRKAEKEFVESKIDLHEKAEMKEQLTEHLYTIIHQNEVRKSQKLASLMSQLEMEVDLEGIEGSLVDLPPLTSFNSVQTLSPSHVVKPLSYPPAESAATGQNNVTVTETVLNDSEPPFQKVEETQLSAAVKSEIESQTTDSVNISKNETCVDNNNDVSVNELLQPSQHKSNNVKLTQNSPDLIPAEHNSSDKSMSTADSQNPFTQTIPTAPPKNPDIQEK